MPKCPICERQAVAGLDLYDDRYGHPGRFRLQRCTACDHRFLGGAAFSDAEIQALYSTYYPRRTLRLEDYRAHVPRSGFSAWLDGAKASAFRWVPPAVRVLDIGCGFGQALGYHVARGCEAWGVESDENVRRIADRHGFNVRIGVFRPEDFPHDYFDAATLDQVIEHVRDPVATLAGVRTVLKPGGLAYVATPNASGWGARVFGRRWINWHAPYHLHFFSRESMGIAAQRAGLGARALGTLTSSEWLGFQWHHLAEPVEPGQPSRFWTQQPPASTPERLVYRGVGLMHRLKLNHLATRLFDAIGLGDSQLFVLQRTS